MYIIHADIFISEYTYIIAMADHANFFSASITKYPLPQINTILLNFLSLFSGEKIVSSYLAHSPLEQNGFVEVWDQ